MLDKAIQRALKPLMTRAARGMVRLGVGADAISLAGFAVGMGAATAIALQHDWVGLALLLISRLMDGLDGAVARATQPTDRGGFLDITLDFDSLALRYVKAHPSTRYLFLSSGAAYGSDFRQPATDQTRAGFDINHLQVHDWYGAAKFHAECRHRALADLAMVDLRVFSYFSRSQDLSSRFLISDMLRAIRDAARDQGREPPFAAKF